MSEYVDVEIPKIDGDLPDVHLKVGNVKLDLPNIMSAEIPVEVLQASSIVASKPLEELSQEDVGAVYSAFLAYFQKKQPAFWWELRRTGQPIATLMATVDAWARESSQDPKSQSSRA